MTFDMGNYKTEFGSELHAQKFAKKLGKADGYYFHIVNPSTIPEGRLVKNFVNGFIDGLLEAIPARKCGQV